MKAIWRLMLCFSIFSYFNISPVFAKPTLGSLKTTTVVEEDLNKYRVVYKGEKGPGVGKNIVFVATDHEYRGEETLPALARIMAKRYGFTCTVIFALDENDNILPGGSNLKGLNCSKRPIYCSFLRVSLILQTKKCSTSITTSNAVARS